MTHMPTKTARPRVLATGVVGVVVLAAGAGAAAAAQEYIITSKSQIAPKVVKQLKGKTGPVGPVGAAGPPQKWSR